VEDMGLEMKIAQLAAHRLWSRLWHVSTGALLVIDAFLSQQAEARAAIKVSAGQGKGNSEEGTHCCRVRDDIIQCVYTYTIRH